MLCHSNRKALCLCGWRNSVSKTAPDSAFMHMKKGRARNAQCKPRNCERGKTKKYKGNMALRENMACDAEQDGSIGQAGQKLQN